MPNYKYLKSDEIKSFIAKNLYTDKNEIILRYSGNEIKDLPDIVEQIECKKKAFRKVPSLEQKYNFIYSKIPLEQSSSEFTANYKLKLVEGNRLADLTGGLGIDLLYLSNLFEEITYIELSKNIYEMFLENLSEMNLSNIKTINGNSINVIKEYPDKYFDWIFIDPARRDDKQRSVDLNYCSPNVIENSNLINKKSKNILIKLSPAFDYTEAVRLFPSISEYSVISVNGECKEVLLLFKEGDHSKLRSAVLIIRENPNNFKRFELKTDEEYKIIVNEEISNYIFIPDASIIKSGLQNKVAANNKLHFINEKILVTHGDTFIKDYPGRVLRVIGLSKYSEKEFKKYISKNKITHINVIVKGMSFKTSQIKEKFKLKDGGDDYIIILPTNSNKKNFIHATSQIEK